MDLNSFGHCVAINHVVLHSVNLKCSVCCFEGSTTCVICYRTYLQLQLQDNMLWLCFVMNNNYTSKLMSLYLQSQPALMISVPVETPQRYELSISSDLRTL